MKTMKFYLRRRVYLRRWPPPCGRFANDFATFLARRADLVATLAAYAAFAASRRA